MSTRNLDALFAPKAIVVIGASNRHHSVGEVLARNLFGAGFKGPVMPVNPHEATIRSTIAYASVADLPVVPDLAVIATPAQTVPQLVAELGAKGCRAAIVISSGFEDAALRQELLDAARPHLMRIVGPNCMGFVSPLAGINASFAHLLPRAGDLAFVSQSGAIATTVLDWADVRGIGFSHVISIGDMCDVDTGDLLDYLAIDPKTRAILLYVESVTEARKLMSAARIAARTKPVVVIKAGRQKALKPGLTHMSALARSDDVFAAAFRRAGMLQVATLRELFEAVGTLATGMRPRGNRVAIVTNGGGAGTLAADAVALYGGQLAQLSETTLQKLAEMLPKGRTVTNPVDLLREADGALYAQALSIVLADPGQDGVLVMNCPTAIADGVDAARATIATAKASPRRSLLTCWLGERAARDSRRLFAENAIPTYDTPDEAVRAFMQLVDYRHNQDMLMQTPPAVAAAVTDREGVRQLLQDILAQGRHVLNPSEAGRLLQAYGIPIANTAYARNGDEAAQLAQEMGFPVALKIVSSDIVHKSEVGGVRLELDTPELVREAAGLMERLVSERRPDASIQGFSVQKMLHRPRAHEVIVGIGDDASFGPVIMVGQGGTAAEIIGDRAIGLPPLNMLLAREMIGRTRVSRLFTGHGGNPVVDETALAATLVRLSQMLVDLPELEELDINPLLCDESGVVALDAHVSLRPASGSGASRFAIQPYPQHLEETVALKGGAQYRLAPVRPEDEGALIEMLERSHPEDIRLRFFAPIRNIGHSFAARLTQIDYSREMAFVARPLGVNESEILGAARIILDAEEEEGEFGIMVRSDQKGRGLGYALMQKILDYAATRGVKKVFAEVLAENTSMLALARELGFVGHAAPDDPTVRHIEIDLTDHQ
ncbi:bifunctional acetate--CoA ligase family protein/GNAT family N-acetyltransferase [Aureimonas fodinaquatilis]|uniref:Bifunctional acetate--CoA ligase family protein/GNAT family N-acetyltransferase n=1 Tax=Aureimonas fodinaquatilis TaxID=2565783 RepID=A0A5B0E0F2_9HYPH|nr:bifunctional acetate--CoA ligase family protein/GNAT family N-acetyltransferase [Aureimonas fodinaquatilis]KAA0972108.1 bifunctional acetate--CoA ligase family protein/GNAT family N-acetyltransferase [Aureimonas fodinaquatilis]